LANAYLHVAEWLLEGLAGFLADFYIKKHLGNNEARYQRYKVYFYFWLNMIYVKVNSSSIRLLQIMVACTWWPRESLSCHHCYWGVTLHEARTLLGLGVSRCRTHIQCSTPTSVAAALLIEVVSGVWHRHMWLHSINSIS
jgi:hypothetical protein